MKLSIMRSGCSMSLNSSHMKAPSRRRIRRICCMVRASATMSAWPAATMASACSGSVMRPTAIVGRPVSWRIPFGEGNLVARFDRDLLPGRQPAARHIDERASAALQKPGATLHQDRKATAGSESWNPVSFERKNMSTIYDLFFGPIHTYSRAQAIEDGLLVDVSEIAAEAGFRLPVAMTRTVWGDCVEWSEEDNRRQVYQDQGGRLWDVVWMAAQAARRDHGDRLAFQLYRVPRGGRSVRPRLVPPSAHRPW